MSKTLSFRGSIIPGTDAQRVKLATMNGKTGYKITKFQLMPSAPGGSTFEFVFQVFKKSASTSTTVDFTDGSLLAVAYYAENATAGNAEAPQTVIFDNEIFNQDIYVTGADAQGNTSPCNFYLELETMSLSDLQATQLTLRNLRTIASR